MQGESSPWQVTGGWLAVLILALALHVALTLQLPQAGWVTSLGMGSVLGVALARCLSLARIDPLRGDRWGLLAAAFALWIAAYASIAWTQAVLHSDSNFVLLDSLLFMARAAPILLILVHDHHERHARLQRLDVAQAVLFVGIAAALLFPGMMPDWGRTAEPVRDVTAFSYREGLNIATCGVALVAWHVQPSNADRRFVRRVALLWIGYTAVAMVTNRLYEWLGPDVVAPGSPLWLSLDPVVAIFILSTLRDPTDSRIGASAPIARDVFGEAMRRFAPSILTAVMLGMCGIIAMRTPIAGVIAAMLAVGLYGIRSVTMQVRYVETLDHLEQAHGTLKRLAERDPLTGLANRRVFDAALRAAWADESRAKPGFGLLLAELDLFADYAAACGTGTSDLSLQRCAVLIEACAGGGAGSGGLVAHHGDGAFAILGDTATLAQAVSLGEAIRSAIAREAIPHPRATRGILTISVGVSIVAAGDRTAQDVMARAQDALQRARARGGDQIATAPWPVAVAR